MIEATQRPLLPSRDRGRSRATRLAILVVGAGLAALAGCGGGGSAGTGATTTGPLGSSAVKPGGSGFLESNAFLVEENQGGSAPEFRILDMAWGRLVDIYDTKVKPGVSQAEYDLDPLNAELYDTRLVYPDFIIGEDVRTAFEGGLLKWELTSNPVSGESRLRINANAEVDRTLFSLRAAQAAEGLKPVDPKGFSATELPPYSVIARNAALSIRFDDLIDPATVGLHSTVKVFAGEPPIVPFDARVLPDPNFGGIAKTNGKFRPTRIIVDFTISQNELASIAGVVQANGIGLPSSENALDPNVAIRIPSKVNSAVGQFSILRSPGGGTIDTDDSGPIDSSSPTFDVVWGLRSGNPDDENNGFLVDLEQPRVIGVQPITIINASLPDPGSTTTEDLLVTVRFDVEDCSFDPVPGDVLQISEVLALEVIEASTAVGTTAANIKVNVPFDADPVSPSDLPGLAVQYLTPWRENLGLLAAPCFVRFSPAADTLPAIAVDPTADLLIRFSEPIDPDSTRPFDTFYIARDPNIDASLSENLGGLLAPKPSDLILGTALPSPDFREIRFEPTVPFQHEQGVAERYYFNLVSSLEKGGVTDLAGNVLDTPLPRIDFELDPDAPPRDTGGWVLRFNSNNEDEVSGPEIRGQILFDLTAGLIRPRPVQHFSAVVDRSQPTVGVMQAITTGLQTPLSSQGSKAHLMWRYMDAGFDISQTNDLFYNLDIEGLALSPLGGQVVATVYDEFEIRLGHASNLPDEIIDPNNLLPKFPASGFGNTASFAENYLSDPLAGPKVVHPRELGFAVANTGVFLSQSGTPMLQMPWNVGKPEEDKTFFTWRNTAVQTYGNKNGDNLQGNGAPTEQEILVLGLTDAPGVVFGDGVGDHPVGIPAPGLPLLMEYRCYPSEESSLNNFDVSIAVTSSPRPFFRAFSTGGTNASGQTVNKDPDLQNDPTGGFNGNPQIGPLGAPTNPRDPTVYMGQMDIVIRLSRAYTVLVDAEQNPGVATGVKPYDYVAAVVEPSAGKQPNGTAVIFDWRGENVASFDTVGPAAMIDASKIDVFGEPIRGPLTSMTPENAAFPWTDPSWHPDLSAVDGKRFVQTRITFVGNTESELTPTLTSYGLAFYR